MGRLIDADDLEKQILEYYQNQLSEIEAMAFVEFLAFIDDFPTVEAIPKANYENRLKADMVAMLEDLDLQIDELAAYNLEVAKVQRLIRDKINSLEEGKDGKFNNF